MQLPKLTTRFKTCNPTFFFHRHTCRCASDCCSPAMCAGAGRNLAKAPLMQSCSEAGFLATHARTDFSAVAAAKMQPPPANKLSQACTLLAACSTSSFCQGCCTAEPALLVKSEHAQCGVISHLFARIERAKVRKQGIGICFCLLEKLCVQHLRHLVVVQLLNRHDERFCIPAHTNSDAEISAICIGGGQLRCELGLASPSHDDAPQLNQVDGVQACLALWMEDL